MIIHFLKTNITGVWSWKMIAMPILIALSYYREFIINLQFHQNSGNNRFCTLFFNLILKIFLQNEQRRLQNIQVYNWRKIRIFYNRILQ